MLKAEIEGEGVPSKGTPQGGILSPLLSNIVLHDLDKWVSGQWEDFKSVFPYRKTKGKIQALKRTNLKEGYIVRYADDFKIICRNWKTAQKWYHAVRLYLETRLKLEISPDKSQIVNLRKRESEFLGFTIRAAKKGNQRVAHTGISNKKQEQIKRQAKDHIRKLRQSPSAQKALLYNSFILGEHNYFNRATLVSLAFSRLAYDLRKFTYNHLRQVGIYEHPSNPPPTYKKFYSTNYRTFKVRGVYLFPLKNVKTVNNMNFSQSLNPFTIKGRELIHKNLRPDIQRELIILMKSNIPDRSVEYLDNRISRYSMKMGKCEVTGVFLFASDVHCHHYLPIHLGGTDKFDNLKILQKDVHKLIHATDKKMIVALTTSLCINEVMAGAINQYRLMCNLELIDLTM
jgi:RNA-directed DNA polymerase